MKRQAQRESSGGPVPILDGTIGKYIVEASGPESPAGQPQLLIWDGERTRIADHLEHHDVTYLPARLEPDIARAVRFPPGAAAYGSTRELFLEVSTLLSERTHLPEASVTQFVFFVFAAWLADRLPVAPFLWIVAPPTASRDPLLQLLALLCRRTLLLSEPTTAALRSLPVELKPTIVSELGPISRSVLNVFRISQRPGTYVAAGNKLVDVSGAKIVFANEPLHDAAMAGFPLEVALAPSSGYSHPIDRTEAEQLFTKFQSKLLMYRLVNYGKVNAKPMDLSEFTVPTQKIAHALTSSIVDDDELRSRIVPLLKQRDREIQVERSEMLESIVLEALLASCCASTAGTLSMIDLTKKVNTILAGRGDTRVVSPENVGWRLRGLGLHTQYIAGGRKGLPLHADTEATIRKLASAHGVRMLQRDLTHPGSEVRY